MRGRRNGGGHCGWSGHNRWTGGLFGCLGTADDAQREDQRTDHRSPQKSNKQVIHELRIRSVSAHLLSSSKVVTDMRPNRQSERKFQSKLQNTRIHYGRRYLPERRASKSDVRIVELGVVERIKEFGAELEAKDL